MNKSILERGIDDLRDDVDDAVERYPKVQDAEAKLNAVLTGLEKRTSFKMLIQLKDAICVARSEDKFAAFRLGVTEGFKLANSVRALIGSEGVVPHE